MSPEDRMHADVGRAPLAVRLIRYIGRIQVFAACLAIPLSIYLASVGTSGFLFGVLNGLGYAAPADFAFHEAGRVSGRALITILLYGPLLRFVERRNLLGVRIMAALALLRGLASGEWILAAPVLILSFWRSTGRYLKSAPDAQQPTATRGEVMMDSMEAQRPQEARAACPCCAYLTLTVRAAYEICSLCYWEDDGQDTANATEVWSDPNHGYSLAEARSNFQIYLSMYPPDEDPRFVGGDNPQTTTIKRSLIATFDKMRTETAPEMMSALWHEVERHEQELQDELFRRVEAGD